MKIPDYQFGFDGMSFDRMLEKMEGGWRSTETPCGCGSELRYTHEIRKWLPHLVEDYEIELIADCGAGDLNWIKHVDWFRPYPHLDSFDLVPRDESVTRFDVTADILETEYHLIICRHVLNHLSARLALNSIENFIQSGSKYLLITNCDNQTDYWLEHSIQLGKPIGIWNDATKWSCELHDLQSEEFWRKKRDADL